MMTEYKKIACVADESGKAQEAYKSLVRRYEFIKDVEEADAIVALGGDGFMLHSMHEYMDMNIPIYGMNCGTVGFLMNAYRENDLLECINKTKVELLSPLQMMATDKQGKHHHALAVNEVSLLRQTKQAAHIKVSVDNRVRVEELVCDGILVATPAGSTAYNLSVHGPIIPMGSQLLVLTPVSPFRPRRWKGALLSQRVLVRFDILDSDKRPVSAVADFTEIRDVISVEVREDRDKSVKVLFDRGHSLEERIISEQFMS